MAAKSSEDAGSVRGQIEMLREQRARQLPRHPDQHRQGHGDARLARRADQHQGEAAGELRPRDHGALHDRRRELHRSRRVCRGAGLHRLESGAPGRGRRSRSALRVRLQRRPARHRREDIQLSDLSQRQPDDSGARGRRRHAGRPGFHRRAGRQSEYRQLSGAEAVPVLHQRVHRTAAVLRVADRVRVSVERVRDEGGRARGAAVAAILGSRRLLRALRLAGGIRRPRDEGHRLGRLHRERRADAAVQHGSGPLRAARRRGMGRRPRLVLDRRDAGADEFRVVARRESEVQSGAGGEAGVVDAGRVAVVFPRAPWRRRPSTRR